MARKKIVISNQELTPTVLATVKKKGFNPLYLIFIFAIFGSVVFYLPEISKKVDSYLHPSSQKPNDGNAVIPNGNDKNELKNNNIVLEIVKNENKNLTINIKNISGKELDLNNFYYYLELSDGKDGNERIRLNNVILQKDEENNLSYSLKNDGLRNYKFKEILPDNYPEVNLAEDIEKKSTLVCTKNNQTVKYNFLNKELYSLEDEYKISTSDSNYATLLEEYKNTAIKNQEVIGLSSSLETISNELVFKTIADYTKNINLNYPLVGFKKGTSAKVVKFEIDANGYTCK